MKKWERFEEYLFDYELNGTSFTSRRLAASMHVSYAEASDLIQAYLEEQARDESRTLYVLTRTGRTNSAVWHVGARASDARAFGRQVADDFRRRYERAIEPTMRQIAVRNPRALPAAQGVLKAIDGGLELIAAMLNNPDD